MFFLNRETVDCILNYWFGDLSMGWTVTDCYRLWFGGHTADDDYMRTHFGELIEHAVNGNVQWDREVANNSMVLILLTDQMTRATKRGTTGAFLGDSIAFETSCHGIDKGLDQQLPVVYRLFYYLPFMHSERLEHQNRSIVLYRTLCEEFPIYKESLKRSYEEAIFHRDLIARFGRFPHRNVILGRDNTMEENNYLKESGRLYGQKLEE